MSGSIPEELCGLKNNLNTVDLSNNFDMKGSIPECFGDLSLSALRVDNIGFTGTVPKGLCTVRNMNGLTPNPFGCAAIACPAGTYQPLNGRQQSNDSSCLPCDVPSNVIGSEVCVLLDGNEVYTVSPTSSSPPSASLSLTPSVLPSSVTSLEPSVQPSRKDSPQSILVSQAPTPLARTHYVDFSLQIKQAHALMESSETVAKFENILLFFIKETMTRDAETMIDVVSASVLSQSLENPKLETLNILQTASYTGHPSRLLDLNSSEAYSSLFLTLSIRVVGNVSPFNPPPSFSFSDTVLSGFAQDSTAFFALLSSSSLFGQVVQPAAATGFKSTDETSYNRRVFFGTTIPLISIGCVIIAVYLRRRARNKSNFVKHRNATSVQGPFNFMPSESIDTDDVDNYRTEPPLPGLSRPFRDVHQCASSICSNCNESVASSGIYFAPVQVSQCDNILQRREEFHLPLPKLVLQSLSRILNDFSFCSYMLMNSFVPNSDFLNLTLVVYSSLFYMQLPTVLST